MPPRGPSDPRYRTSDTSDLLRKSVIKFDIFCQGKYGIGQEADTYRFQYEMSTPKLADNLTFANIKDGSLVLAASIDKDIHIMKVFLTLFRQIPML